MATPSPPLSEKAQAFLDTVDALPVRVPERERLIRTFETLYSAEWLRVLLKLNPDDVAGLRQPGHGFISGELGQVIAFATLLAGACGHETVGVPHIAAAFGGSAKVSGGRREEILEVFRECFGLGGLDEVDKVFQVHFGRLEHGAAVPTSERTEPYDLAVAPRHVHFSRFLLAIDILLRVILGILLILMAVYKGVWWAWLFPLVVLLPTRDPAGVDLGSIDYAPGARFRSRWCLHGLITVICWLLGLVATGSLIMAFWILSTLLHRTNDDFLARRLRIWVTGKPVPTTIERLGAVAANFGATRRYRRTTVAFLVGFNPALLGLLATPLELPLFGFTVFFSLRKWWFLSPIIAVSGVLTHRMSPWTAAAACACGLTARTLLKRVDEPPNAPVPIPFRFDGQFRRLRRARRLLQKGRPEATLLALDGVRGNTARALRGWALLIGDRPADAKAAVAGLLGSWDPTRLMITGLAELDLANAEEALSILETHRDTRWGLAHKQARSEVAIGISRAWLAHNGQLPMPWLGAIAGTVELHPSRTSLLNSTTQLRLCAELARRYDRRLAVTILEEAKYIYRLATADQPMHFFSLLGPRRNLEIELARIAVVDAAFELEDAGSNLNTGIYLERARNTADMLFRLSRPIEAAEFLNFLADSFADDPRCRADAFSARLQALTFHNAARHELRHPPERQRWWRSTSATLDKALHQAVAGQDWETVAELIETARLQLGPEAFENSTVPAPLISVRGISRLGAWQGYRVGQAPETYAIEDMAVLAQGAGTWWWSTWSAADQIYWALVPPEGLVHGGSLACGPGTDVNWALEGLAIALPIPLPGEGPGDVTERVRFGPLNWPRAERANNLPRHLSSLLPPPLAHRLQSGPTPLPVAMSHAQNLADVPWAIAEIPGLPASRLLERTILSIAPPSRLLTAISRRDRRKAPLPLHLAVTDPGGILSGASHALTEAASLSHTLPDEVVLIGPNDLVTVSDFAATLRTTPRSSTAFFACHTDAAGASPFERGLLLKGRPDFTKPPAPEDILTARQLMAEPELHPMPRQVIASACDSADLRSAEAGEWLVLGPALLWAGADRIIVTGHPIADNVSVDTELIQRLLLGLPLLASLRDIQVERLARWKAGESGPAAPHLWAGHLAMGAFGNEDFQPRVTPSVQPTVGQSVISLLDDAAGRAADARRTTVSMADLLLELGLYGWEDELSPLRRRTIRALTYPWAIWRHVRRTRGRTSRNGIDLDDRVLDLLRRTRDIVARTRHPATSTESLLLALLGETGVTGWLTRTCTGWDPVQPEVLTELVAEALDESGRELPTPEDLSIGAVLSIYEALGAATPFDLQS